MAFKIYTKTGDKGETSLFGGRRVPKSELRIDAYGTVDELNAHIGLLRDGIADEASRAVLLDIQNRLFVVGACLATDPEKSLSVPDLKPADIELLEARIDAMEQGLEPLKYFILPGGHPVVSQCHVARCVCRRAERLTVALHLVEPIDSLVLEYLNRLSDYLFVLSRHLGQLLGVAEIPWRGRAQGS
jgi:cob(I)alamin adenosyltransferase